MGVKREASAEMEESHTRMVAVERERKDWPERGIIA